MPPKQLAWNFSVETLRGFINRTNLRSNEKAFLSAIVALSYAEGQQGDGQTFCGSIEMIGHHPYLRRGINTARRIKQTLITTGLLAVTVTTGASDTYCINWDAILELPTLEESPETPPESRLGPLQSVPSTPPILGGDPSNSGRGTPPILEGTPPILGGVGGGVPPKTAGKNGGTPPKLEGSAADMSLSVFKTERQRHVTVWWPKAITQRDLRTSWFLEELWKLAVRNAWFTPTPDNRLHFFAHAARCCDAKNPGGAFTANVRAKRLFYRAEDAEWARLAIESLDRQREPFTGQQLVENQSDKDRAKLQYAAWMARREAEDSREGQEGRRGRCLPPTAADP